MDFSFEKQLKNINRRLLAKSLVLLMIGSLLLFITVPFVVMSMKDAVKVDAKTLTSMSIEESPNYEIKLENVKIFKLDVAFLNEKRSITGEVQSQDVIWNYFGTLIDDKLFILSADPNVDLTTQTDVSGFVSLLDSDVINLLKKSPIKQLKGKNISKSILPIMLSTSKPPVYLMFGILLLIICLEVFALVQLKKYFTRIRQVVDHPALKDLSFYGSSESRLMDIAAEIIQIGRRYGNFYISDNWAVMFDRKTISIMHLDDVVRAFVAKESSWRYSSITYVSKKNFMTVNLHDGNGRKAKLRFDMEDAEVPRKAVDYLIQKRPHIAS